MAALALLPAGCRHAMDPEASHHDRVHFESPVQVVEFVYQNLRLGNYDDIPSAFLEYTDRREWIAWEESGESHPWTRDAEAEARTVGIHERPGGDVLIYVVESWSGGESGREFRCRSTPDGWRIVEVEGVAGSALLPAP